MRFICYFCRGIIIEGIKVIYYEKNIFTFSVSDDNRNGSRPKADRTAGKGEGSEFYEI